MKQVSLISKEKFDNLLSNFPWISNRKKIFDNSQLWAKLKGYIFLSHSKFDHENIVGCLGITSDPRGELLLILELMEGGDLRKYLRSHRQKEVYDFLLTSPKSMDIFTDAIIVAISLSVESKRKRKVVFDWPSTLLRSPTSQMNDGI